MCLNVIKIKLIKKDLNNHRNNKQKQDGRDSATGKPAGPAPVAQSENESEEEQVIDDDTLSQFLGIVSQDDKHYYSLKEINTFLDYTFGRQSVKVAGFSPDVGSLTQY